MQIRPVKQGDLKQVFDLYMEGYDEEDFTDVNRLKKPSPKVMPAWSKRIMGDIKNGHLTFLVAVDGDSVLGFCFAKKKDVPDSELSHVGILGMRVTRDMRGKGIGKAMMREIIKRSRGRFEMLELSVMSTNTVGKRLYGKAGFRRWGIAPRAVKRGRRYIDMEHMALRLK